MTESDLARPVIEIRNFEDNVLEHEIYTFGEENVIVPVGKKVDKIGIEKLAEEKIKGTFRRYDPHFEVEILGVGYDTANQDTEGIEHHLNPKTIKQLRKFITFLKANPKIIDNFKNL